MDTLKDLENTLVELYEAGLVMYHIDDNGEVVWELTPIAREAMRLGLDPTDFEQEKL